MSCHALKQENLILEDYVITGGHTVPYLPKYYLMPLFTFTLISYAARVSQFGHEPL